MTKPKNRAILVTCAALFMLLLNADLHAFPPRPDPAAREEIKQTMFSRSLQEERTISISLPDAYAAGTGSFPVLFVLDAESRKGWGDSLSTVENLHSAGTIPQMIVVGVWNTVRNRDMIPATVAHRPGSGGSRQFLDFLTGELAPHIRRDYKASNLGIIYGASNAGLFVVYALLERPEAFRAYIAGSPMIGHCPDFMQEKAEGFVSRPRVGERTLYMIYGDQDSGRVTGFVPGFQKFLESNAPEGLKSRLDILAGEGHVPESSLSRGLNYVFNPANSPPVSGKRPR